MDDFKKECPQDKWSFKYDGEDKFWVKRRSRSRLRRALRKQVEDICLPELQVERELDACTCSWCMRYDTGPS